MSETREAIARAICNRRKPHPYDGDAFDNLKTWVLIQADGAREEADGYLADADAVLAALSQAGLVIVPKEPTDAMRVAGFDNNEVHSYFHGAEPAWRAMIDAAGKP